MTHKTKATGAVANGKTLNISPAIIAICWLVGNVSSVVACWWIVSQVGGFCLLLSAEGISRQKDQGRTYQEL